MPTLMPAHYTRQDINHQRARQVPSLPGSRYLRGVLRGSWRYFSAIMLRNIWVVPP
jgi:hypothetical protein